MLVEAMLLAMAPAAPVGPPQPVFVPGTPLSAPDTPVLVPDAPGGALSEERTPEWELKQAAQNLFELIAKPDPRYATFVRFTDRTRVWLVLDRGGGLADNRLFEGQAARDTLAGMFGPKPGTSATFAPPETEMDGPFGRAKVAIKIRDGTKAPACGTAYLDALLKAPGSWAKAAHQGLWEFTQITLSFGRFQECPG